MKLGGYRRRRFYQKEMNLVKEIRSSLLFPYLFLFFKKKPRKVKKKKSFRCHGCLTEWLDVTLRKYHALVRVFGESSKGLML